LSIVLTINGVGYDYPETDDQTWGPDATEWAIAVTAGMLQKSAGLFQVLAELDFGSAYGVKALYYKTRTTNIADAGQIRLARADTIVFRNQANSGNLVLGIDTSDRLTYNGNPIIDSAALTASRALVSSAAGVISVSSVTSTELGYVGGVTSSIQTQIDAILAGDVEGPVSSTDNAMTRFDGITGRLLQNSGAILDDSNNLTGLTSVVANGITIGSAANRISGLATIINSGTLTLPTSTDTLVGRATTDTLTNKTLTAPVIATIVNSGTLTLPTSTDTLVGRATTDTLTNKTLGSPTFTGQLSLPNGTVAAPTLLFSSAGIYSTGAQNIDFSVNGVQTANFNSASAIIRTNLQIQGGGAASPGLNFQSSPVAGLYMTTVNIIGFATAGVTAGTINASQIWSIGVGTAATQIINGGALRLQSGATSEFAIIGDSGNASSISLTGAGASSNGGVVSVYGNSHASKANVIEFLNAGSASSNFDASGHLNLLGQRALRLQDTTGGEYVGLRASSTQTTYTITFPSAAPATNALLKYDGANYIWSLQGDVSGPVSSTDTAVAKFSGTTGKILQDTGVLIDSGNSVTMNRLAVGGSALSSSGILNNSPSAVQNPLSGVTQRAFRTSMVGTSAATTEVVGFSSAVSTDAAAFTAALRTHFHFANQTKGAGSTITRDLGFGGSIPTQGTNNALLADNTAFTGDWVINSSSASASLFSGPMEWKQQATPSNPASGNNRIYFKADGNLYKLTSAGVETAFAAGSGDINQNGNSFGTTMTLGTNDAFSLAFETNGVTNGSVTSAGAWALGATGFTGTHTLNANTVRILPGSGVESVLSAKADNAGSLALAGASGSSNGGVIVLHGNSHASKANIIEFQNAAAIRGSISAAGLWTIGTAAGTEAHVVNGGLDVVRDLKVTTAGMGLFVKEGSNAKMGVSTLVAGTVTVSTTAVTASSRIFLTSQSDGGTPGFQRITARTAATSFVITSSNGADTSVIAWMIVEPA